MILYRTAGFPLFMLALLGVILHATALVLFHFIILFYFNDFIYLFSERGEGREKERERNIDRLLFIHARKGTQSATQAYMP